MTELKPCPFCGGEAEYRAAKYVRTVFKHSVVCLECFASVPPKASEQEAIEAWNTRAERTCHVELVDQNESDPVGVAICSECGSNGFEIQNSNYCSYCGAKVVE